MADFFSWVGSNVGLAFAIFFVAYAILAAFVILLENREPEKTIAWILALLLIPFIGFIFYLFFGRDWHKRTYRRERRSRLTSASAERDLARLGAHLAGASELERSVRLLDASMTGLDPTDGNRVTILTDAQEKYPRLFSALKKATRTIDVEYYIFRDDATGGEMIKILKERARAGVTVRFLVDGMGSLGFGRTRFADMREAGIKCHYFSPLITLLYFLKANYRDHRKIVVVDDEVVFTGGINIGDEYLGRSDRGHWRDTSVEIAGPCVSSFSDLFEEAWRRTTGDARRSHPRIPLPLPGGERVDVVASGPDDGWKAIHQHYLALIHGARRVLRIQTPYFIPDEALLAALIQAALRGVHVELMLPRNPDWPYLRWVAYTYLEDMLRAGVHVYEYRTGFLHTKAFIVDNAVASVGTCNVDIRSLRLDFEVNVFLSGHASVRHLSEDFDRDLALCDEIRYADFVKRPFSHRVLESLARLISPLL